MYNRIFVSRFVSGLEFVKGTNCQVSFIEQKELKYVVYCYLLNTCVIVILE